MSAPETHRRYAPNRLGFAVVTVSDSRTEADDAGGAAVRRLVEGEGHRVVGGRIVRDEVVAVRGVVGELLREEGVDVLVLTGGTGVSPRDVTPEAVGPLLERRVEGFGELFRYLSFGQVGAAAMLSRAGAGVAGGRAVFWLPGSPAAVELAMRELILPEAGHLIGQARRRGGVR
jgi:molybdenum cofactor biosynthesis protein B